MLAVLATKLFAGGQKRVNPRVVAVFYEQMGLEKSKTFLYKDFYYTARGNSITHPFLVHVTIDRTADYRRTVWQVFCDLQTRRKQQYQCHNIYIYYYQTSLSILTIYRFTKFKNMQFMIPVCTHNFQTLVGASLHAQSITGG